MFSCVCCRSRIHRHSGGAGARRERRPALRLQVLQQRVRLGHGARARAARAARHERRGGRHRRPRALLSRVPPAAAGRRRALQRRPRGLRPAARTPRARPPGIVGTDLTVALYSLRVSNSMLQVVLNNSSNESCYARRSRS